ncbi:unnamed protein product [Bemisia tabaci]|uniref:26S proteasome non-ATPase regulatory subunit 4 n=1 Tax=Bemisia tabaci TaxID=7038 RepID=A0A9P0A1M1_BEMTA|nr:PREDICTED: 26S proteasome non-ATPase regulatory subunit 4 [Bemisia tabaci]CAH0382150.1 unnamed protein product [Bemisia tabaci]
MVLESTMICVDNSDFMRNGDFIPTRLQAQQDAINVVCHSKTRSNPENNVGLLTMANVKVVSSLTSDVGRILSKLHQIQPDGEINFLTGIRVAHLALKHRQGKNHKMRIVVFIGSPVNLESKEMTKLAKRLKKEKVNVDIVSFGEEISNNDALSGFINILNGKEGGGSHLVTVPPPHLSDALISSPVILGEDGAGPSGFGTGGYEFGVDPNEDPELALALRVSMEEQRQRQEQDARKTETQTSTETNKEGTQSELERALAMSLDPPSPAAATAAKPANPVSLQSLDFTNMSEDEQIAFAMQMSMQESQEPAGESSSSTTAAKKEDEEMDYSEVMSDPMFLQSVLENLPGVDPQSEAVRQAVDSLTSDKKEKKDTKGGDSKKSDDAEKK